MKFCKRLIALICVLLVFSMAAPVIFSAASPVVTTAEAASKPKLNKKKLSLRIGDTFQLKVINSSKSVKWSSSDKSVVKINKKTGLLTAKKAGTAAITAKVGNKELTCKVTVKGRLTCDHESLNMNPGDSIVLNIKPYPLNKGHYTVSYAIRDKDIVDCKWGDGFDLTVKAKEPGKTVITITWTMTKEKLSIPVTVNSPLTVQLPSLPVTLREYDYKGRVEQEYVITDIKYETKYYSYSNDYTVTLYFAGRKTFDIEGAYTSRSPKIGWKLYNTNGAVVKDDTCYAPSCLTGESWSLDGAKDYAFDMHEGSYRLELISVR